MHYSCLIKVGIFVEVEISYGKLLLFCFCRPWEFLDFARCMLSLITWDPSWVLNSSISCSEALSWWVLSSVCLWLPLEPPLAVSFLSKWNNFHAVICRNMLCGFYLEQQLWCNCRWNIEDRIILLQVCRTFQFFDNTNGEITLMWENFFLSTRYM